MSTRSLNALQMGQLGEHICAISLLKQGISCQIVNLEKTDIIVTAPNKMIRVQVKSSHIRVERHKTPAYVFQKVFGGKKQILTLKECDILAFVALDIERVFFQHVNSAYYKARFSTKKFMVEDVDRISWEESIKEIK